MEEDWMDGLVWFGRLRLRLRLLLLLVVVVRARGSSTRPQQLVRVDPGCTGSDAPPSLTTQPSLLLLQPSTACEPQSKQIVLLSEM